jgi:putative CocE/NonD family hydrolase
MNKGWREAQEWPPAGTTDACYFLHSQGRANGLDGDGALSVEPPSDGSPPDIFLYNPANPPGPAGAAGIHDQRPVEQRQDVLVYSTPPLKEAVEVAGPVRLVLHAATSAPDTDWYAKLVDVSPNGYAANVCDGILRARFHQSDESPRLLEPNRPYAFQVDMLATANLFLPGHQIRLEVSSACFPKFDRNANTAEWPAMATSLQPAVQTIFHDALRPSHLVLPISPRD